MITSPSVIPTVPAFVIFSVLRKDKETDSAFIGASKLVTKQLRVLIDQFLVSLGTAFKNPVNQQLLRFH